MQEEGGILLRKVALVLLPLKAQTSVDTLVWIHVRRTVNLSKRCHEMIVLECDRCQI